MPEREVMFSNSELFASGQCCYYGILYLHDFLHFRQSCCYRLGEALAPMERATPGPKSYVSPKTQLGFRSLLNDIGVEKSRAVEAQRDACLTFGEFEKFLSSLLLPSPRVTRWWCCNSSVDPHATQNASFIAPSSRPCSAARPR